MNTKDKAMAKPGDFVKSDEVTQLKNAKPGTYFKGIVKILRKAKPGPTIFMVTDGTGMIDAVTKESNFETDDVVELTGQVSERAGQLQIEISKMFKAEKNFDEILEAQSEPEEKELSIKSDRLSQMKPHFMKVAKLIRKAIMNNQPIMIRHHADADGIMCGMSIEEACYGLMKELGINPAHNLYRSPSRAPFYEITDMLKDITFTKRVIEGHDQQKPLLLILDNGSTPEDSFAHKTLSAMGFDIIVVDHHNPVAFVEGKEMYGGSQTSVCEYLLYHINPYKYGLDGQTSAGMLCYEIGRQIHSGFDKPMYPAVSAIGDRCDIPETDAYIEVAKTNREALGKMVVAIDFLAYQLKFDAGVGVYDEVFTRQQFVDMINEKVNEGTETQLQSTMPYLRTQEINGVILSHIDLEKYTLRFTYPTPGKVIGMIHDRVAEGHEKHPVLSLGCLSDMIIIRATKPVLPVATIIENLQRDIPEANADGGGHECAGTIKFVSAQFDKVLEHIKSQVRALDLTKDSE